MMRNRHLVVIRNSFFLYAQQVSSSKFHGFRGADYLFLGVFFAEPPLWIILSFEFQINHNYYEAHDFGTMGLCELYWISICLCEHRGKLRLSKQHRFGLIFWFFLFVCCLFLSLLFVSACFCLCFWFCFWFVLFVCVSISNKNNPEKQNIYKLPIVRLWRLLPGI